LLLFREFQDNQSNLLKHPKCIRASESNRIFQAAMRLVEMIGARVNVVSKSCYTV
jgi:hypothetical protein